MRDENRIDRRQFAKQFSAVSGSTAILLAAPIGCVAAADPKHGKPKSDDAPQFPPEQAAPKTLTQEILLLKLLLERYPSEHFNEAAVRGIAADIRGDIARGRILSKFGLKNSDEPCSVFQAYRSSE